MSQDYGFFPPAHLAFPMGYLYSISMLWGVFLLHALSYLTSSMDEHSHTLAQTIAMV
jgi:hypothetical protein